MIVRRTIDKDELKELPKVVFPGRIHVIQSESETEKANLIIIRKLKCRIIQRVQILILVMGLKRLSKMILD